MTPTYFRQVSSWRPGIIICQCATVTARVHATFRTAIPAPGTIVDPQRRWSPRLGFKINSMAAPIDKFRLGLLVYD